MTECSKIPFETEEQARDELIRIINTNHKPWKHKKPCRYYKCTKCNYYHLTSKKTVNEY